ncbi:hypothetical protein D3C85_1643580 [compost metagenome]
MAHWQNGHAFNCTDITSSSGRTLPGSAKFLCADGERDALSNALEDLVIRAAFEPKTFFNHEHKAVENAVRGNDEGDYCADEMTFLEIVPDTSHPAHGNQNSSKSAADE